MTNHIERIRESDDRLVVESDYKRVAEFLDEGDPSPVRQRDLTDDAEKALLYSIIDRESKKPVEYVIRFPVPEVTPEVEAGLPEAVKTSFSPVAKVQSGTCVSFSNVLSTGLLSGASYLCSCCRSVFSCITTAERHFCRHHHRVYCHLLLGRTMGPDRCVPPPLPVPEGDHKDWH